jgi:hypothetical protein
LGYQGHASVTAPGGLGLSRRPAGTILHGISERKYR